MIDIIITSYKEPHSTVRAVQAVLKQKLPAQSRIFVVDPFPEVERILKKKVKDKRVRFFLDPGEGKSYALNLLFQEYGSSNTNDLFILTDGDVYVGTKTVSSIVNAFKDQKVGCVTGRPKPVETKETKYGYWTHVLFDGIDSVRKRLSAENKFFECSGYLFAIRKGVVYDFPLETSEDSIIPYLFWKKGFAIKYAPEAEVFVKSPGNWKDWLTQKVRNIKAHENLDKLAPDLPRTKSFWNEIRYGALFALLYPRHLREVWWTIELFGARLYLYFKSFKEIRKGIYRDGWRGEAVTESTKME